MGQETAGKRVLIMMSAFNGEKYIEEQIRSILSQTFEGELHLRIRDDCSTDSTCDIIERIAEEYPGRLELIRGKRVGLNASYIALLKVAEGYDYYGLSDQDDVWLPSKVRTAVNALEQEDNNIPVLYSSTSYLVDDRLKPMGTTQRMLRTPTLFNTLAQNFTPGHNQFLNNSLLKQISQCTDPGRLYVYDSWIENIAMLKGKIVFNNSPQTLYRQHRGNQMGYGRNTFEQMKRYYGNVHSSRVDKWRMQIEYFAECYEKELREAGVYDSIVEFLGTETVIDRIRYAARFRFYRQKKIETLAMRAAYLLGLF